MYLYTTPLAALLFGPCGYFMKQSEGLNKFLPTFYVCLMLVLGGLLQTLALEKSSLGKTYVFVMALEAVTTFAVAVFMLGERPSVFKLAVTGVIIGSVAALRVRVVLILAPKSSWWLWGVLEGRESCGKESEGSGVFEAISF